MKIGLLLLLSLAFIAIAKDIVHILHPWKNTDTLPIVSIHENWRHLCSGIILAAVKGKKILIGAPAHCLSNRDLTNFKVKKLYSWKYFVFRTFLLDFEWLPYFGNRTSVFQP